MANIGALAIISLIAGLVIGSVALVITIVVIIRSKKYVLPILVYCICLFISLVLIGVFIFAWMATLTPVEVEPTETDYDLLAQDGKIYNEDYSFLLTVGEEHAANFTEVYMVPYDGVSATYVYCYDTSDVDYASIECPGTAVELFRVNVYTLSEWEAVVDSPFVGTKMMETAEHVYELTHPNGLFPEDVPASDTFYNAVSSSFNFAG